MAPILIEVDVAGMPALEQNGRLKDLLYMDTDGENTDFERLVRETQVQIRSYIAGMGVSPNDVDDIAQDTYMSLYRHTAKIPEGVSEIRWLKGIAKNLCFNYFRRMKRGRENFETMANLLSDAEETMEPDRSPFSDPDALGACLQKLSAANRRLIDLHYAERLTAELIAERLKKTAGSIRIAMFRIRVALKDCIERSPERLGAGRIWKTS